MIYHDALQQITMKCTQDWLKAKGYLARFVVPVMGVNSDIKGAPKYAIWAPGNSPEWMPLDCSLFADLEFVYKRHVVICNHLDSRGEWVEDETGRGRWLLLDEESKQRRFNVNKVTKATPHRMKYFVRQIWNSMPFSDRIIQDCSKIPINFLTAITSEGKVIQGVGNKNGGHRHYTVTFEGGALEWMRGTKTRGGAQVKATEPPCRKWLLPKVEAVHQRWMSLKEEELSGYSSDL